MSAINLNQKISNFEYELKKVIVESKAAGVDYRESYKSIQNEQREEIKIDRESIRITRSIFENEIANYNKLLAKYNSLYGKNKQMKLKEFILEDSEFRFRMINTIFIREL